MSGNKNLTTGIIIVVIILIVTISAAAYQQVSSSNDESMTNHIPQQVPMHNNDQMMPVENNDSEYVDGVYAADGNYISPGGAEEIGVTLTLEDGIVVDSEVEVRATREISLAMQNDFAQNYREQVVGRNVDGLELAKVSGSSLTPNGFNNALEQIRRQAREQHKMHRGN